MKNEIKSATTHVAVVIVITISIILVALAFASANGRLRDASEKKESYQDTPSEYQVEKVEFEGNTYLIFYSNHHSAKMGVVLEPEK